MSAFEPFCLITGVTLYNSAEGWCKPADLFIFGDRFIVNASGEGEVRTLSATERVVSFSEMDSHFERRNVYIFPADKSLLNVAAQTYIARGLHASRF